MGSCADTAPGHHLSVQPLPPATPFTGLRPSGGPSGVREETQSTVPSQGTLRAQRTPTGPAVSSHPRRRAASAQKRHHSGWAGEKGHRLPAPPLVGTAPHLLLHLHPTPRAPARGEKSLHGAFRLGALKVGLGVTSSAWTPPQNYKQSCLRDTATEKMGFRDGWAQERWDLGGKAEGRGKECALSLNVY